MSEAKEAWREIKPLFTETTLLRAMIAIQAVGLILLTVKYYENLMEWAGIALGIVFAGVGGSFQLADVLLSTLPVRIAIGIVLGNWLWRWMTTKPQ